MQIKTGTTILKQVLVFLCSLALYTIATEVIFRFIPANSVYRAALFLIRNYICALLIVHLFSGSLLKKLFSLTLAMVISILGETLTLILFTRDSHPYFNSSTSFINITYYINVSLELLVSLLILFLRRGKNKKNHQISKEYILQSTIPILTVCAMLIFFFIEWNFSRHLIFIVFSIVINITLYIVYEKIEYIYEQNNQLQLQKQRHELLEEYYKKIESNQNEVCAIKNEIEDRLSLLAIQLRNQGEEKAAGEIDSLIEQLTSDDKEKTVNIDSENIDFI